MQISHAFPGRRFQRRLLACVVSVAMSMATVARADVGLTMNTSVHGPVTVVSMPGGYAAVHINTVKSGNPRSGIQQVHVGGALVVVAPPGRTARLRIGGR